LQSAYPALHEATRQAELLHSAVPFAARHKLPQVRQLFASLLRSISQPSSGLPLQSPKPGGQLLTPHRPCTHQGVPLPAWQTLPQAPQWLTSLVTFFSRPFLRSSSQSAKPSAHVIWQSPLEQYGVPFSAPHVSPHFPQFAPSLLVFTSQPLSGWPSQSAYGGVQEATTQEPPEHPATACGKVQAAPHRSQCSGVVFRLVSHPLARSPSQSPLPSMHTTLQVPVTHEPLAQSFGEPQPSPARHFLQSSPPQSTPVSVPLSTPSSHVGCAHEPAAQTLLWQSRASVQGSPGAHG
jgi:hypothetical protein